MSTTTDNLAALDQAYFDIFVTALEGGIGYWSMCHRYKWTDEAGQEDHQNFHAVIEEEDGTGEKMRIDRSVIARGVERYIAWGLDHPNRYFQLAALDLKNGNYDHLDVDADIADCIVQLALHNELVYG